MRGGTSKTGERVIKGNRLRFYGARLRLESATNLLESIAIAAEFFKEKHVRHGKSEYQAPFRTLLVALAARCERLFSEVCFMLLAIAETDCDDAPAARAWLENTAKKKFLASHALARQDRIPEAIDVLGKAAEGIAPLEIEMDEALLGKDCAPPSVSS